jgi:phytoene dehydrogenase-like protein
MVCEYENKRYCYFRDLDRFERHLISLAPEDTSAIQLLVRDIKAVSPFPSPFLDLPGVRIDGPRTFTYLGLGAKMLPKLPRFAHRSSLSIGEYMSKFKNRGIRELFLNSTDEDFSTGAILFMLSSVSSNDFLYPIGGSRTIVTGMADAFKKLGGQLFLNTKVDSLHITNGRIHGASSGGRRFEADSVIATVDARTVADCGFAGSQLREPWMASLAKNTRSVIADNLAIGVRTPLAQYPHMTIFPLDEPMPPPWNARTAIKIQNYAGMSPAPPGCATITMSVHGEPSLFDYWAAAKADGSYREKKRRATEFLVAKVAAAVPEIRGKIDFAELATAHTMNRYTGTWMGAYMSYFSPTWNVIGGTYPQKSEILKGLYWAGWRLMRPGGLPPAVMTGRKAIQHICKDLNRTFR